MDNYLINLEDSLYMIDDLLNEVPYDDCPKIIESAIELKVRIENELDEHDIAY